MNQFTKKTRPSKDGAVTGQNEKPWVAGVIVKMALIMVIIAGAFIARVHLNDKTEQLAREKSRIIAQIEEKRTEIQTIKLQIANLRRWDNINAKIRQYNLALHGANPSQVHYMKRFEGQVAGPDAYGSDTRVADSAAARQPESGTIR